MMKFSLFVPNSKLERLSHEAVYAFIIAVFAEGLFHGLVEPKYVAASVGRMVALFCSLYVIGVLSAGFDSSPRVLRAWKDTLALTLITIVFLVVGWSGTIVSVSLADYVAKHMLVEFLSPGALCFIIPYAAGALILQAILGLRFAFVYSLAVGLATIIYDRSALFFWSVCSVVIFSRLSEFGQSPFAFDLYANWGVDFFAVGRVCCDLFDYGIRNSDL